jgi:hypothetical protein
MARPSDHFVGPFHRFDGDDGLMLHGNRLADVERRNGVGHAVPEREILLFILGRCAPGDDAATREQRLNQRRGVQQLDAVVAQHVGHRTNQAVGILRRQLPQHAEERQVGDDAPEDLGVLHLPGHHGVADAGGLQDRDALPELAEGNPMNRYAAPPGRVGQLWKRLFLRRDDGDVVALRARGVEHEKRKASVPGNQANVHRGVILPRRALRSSASAYAESRRAARCG